METHASADKLHMKFVSITKKLVTLTQHRVHDKTTIQQYLKELNQLNYQLFVIQDEDTVKLLINRLCLNIQVSFYNYKINNTQFFQFFVLRVGTFLD